MDFLLSFAVPFTYRSRIFPIYIPAILCVSALALSYYAGFHCWKFYVCAVLKALLSRLLFYSY